MPSKTLAPVSAPTRIGYFDQESGCQVTAEFLTIGPELAEEMLQSNPDNRSISPATVDAYVRAMVNGEWRYVGDPIRLNRDNEILDGGHRLTAVVKSGTTHTFMVVRGIPTEFRSVMDQGRPRTARDNLAMQGVVNGNAKATISALLLRWEMGALGTNRVKLQNQQVVDFVSTNDKPLSRAYAQARAAKSAIGLSIGTGGAVFYRATEIDTFLANEFFNGLITGAGVDSGSPILTVRNMIIRLKQGDRTSRRQVTTPMEMFYVIRAWNGFRSGEFLSKIQLPTSGLTNQNFILK